MNEDIHRTAIVTGDGVYRYALGRTWAPGPYGLFIALNPSTADSEVDDATVRRWTNYARRWGWPGYNVGNLYAYRTTYPKHLRSVEDPVGPNNDRMLQTLLLEAREVVCCWGNGADAGRVLEVLQLIERCKQVPKALALTKGGHPAHVLLRDRPSAHLVPRPIKELRP